MFTKSEFADFMVGATFGMEHTICSADRTIPLPEGNTWCNEEDYPHADSGIATDPRGEFNLFGGELQVKPANSSQELFKRITDLHNLVAPNPEKKYLFPADIHMHIRVPQLLERPDVLRYLIDWGQKWHVPMLEYIFGWKKPIDIERQNLRHQPYFRWVQAINYLGKRTTYKASAIHRLKTSRCKDVKGLVLDLHNNQVRMKDEWKWRCFQPKYTFRPAINYGHLTVNETIEFRCFTATFDEEILNNIVQFPEQYLQVALTGDSDPLKIVRGKRFMPETIFGTAQETDAVRENRVKTNLIWNRRDLAISYIDQLFHKGKITLADLNYPQLWIDRGYQ